MQKINVECTIQKDLDSVWNEYTSVEAIQAWCHASDDWFVLSASNDLRVGGRFETEMSSKDGATSFVWGGVYDDIEKGSHISYTMDDGRKASVIFETVEEGVFVSVIFDSEDANSIDKQQKGWQAILDNFKKHCESKA